AAAAEDAAPIFATVASRFQDPGVERFYRALVEALGDRLGAPVAAPETTAPAAPAVPIVPPARRRYLAEIAEAVRAYRARSARDAARADDAWALARALRALGDEPPAGPVPYPDEALADGAAEPERLAL